MQFIKYVHSFYVCTNLHSGVYSKLSKPEPKFDRCNRIVRKLQYYVIIKMYYAYTSHLFFQNVNPGRIDGKEMGLQFFVVCAIIEVQTDEKGDSAYVL